MSNLTWTALLHANTRMHARMQEEEDDFTPCHERFGISVLYHSSKLEGLGDINLGNALI